MSINFSAEARKIGVDLKTFRRRYREIGNLEETRRRTAESAKKYRRQKEHAAKVKAIAIKNNIPINMFRRYVIRYRSTDIAIREVRAAIKRGQASRCTHTCGLDAKPIKPGFYLFHMVPTHDRKTDY